MARKKEIEASKIPVANLTISNEFHNAIEFIGKDIEILRGSIDKANSNIIDAHNEINTLRRENKALNNILSDSRSRIVLLEENYNNIIEDLDRNAKIDLFIYTVFTVCIICLAYEVYILTH